MQRKLDALGISAFCESMAMMLQAGIQTEEAVGLLRGESSKPGPLETALGQVQQALSEGQNLSDSLAKTGLFPDYAVCMVAAGENSGRLEDVLFRLGKYYAGQKTLSEKLRSAVTYPAAMLVLIIVVLVLMLVMVLPAFTQVYERMTGSLAHSAYGYVQWAYGFCWAALGVMVLLAAALLIGLGLWNSTKRPLVENLLLKIPATGNLLREMGMYRFTAALATFLASGEVQDIAVQESMKMVDCKPVEEKLTKCLKHLEEGHSIAQAAFDEHLFEPVYGRMLLAGERSGSLEPVLWRLTELLEEQCGTRTDRLVGVVDPLLSGILLVTVGVALLSVMLPLLGIMSSIG